MNAGQNVGENAVRAVIAAREQEGRFASIYDFCERVDPAVANKRALESLVKAGAFDSTGATRKGMLEVVEQALAWGSREHADRLLGQASIFDLGETETAVLTRKEHPRSRPPSSPSRSCSSTRRRLSASTSPSIRSRACGRLRAASTPGSPRSSGAGTARSLVGGMMGAVRALTTRRGEPMAFLRLDDLSGSIEVVVFNSVYAAARDTIEPDRIVLVKARVDHKEGETELVGLEVSPLELAVAPEEVRLRVDARLHTRGRSASSRTLCRSARSLRSSSLSTPTSVPGRSGSAPGFASVPRRTSSPR